MPPWRLDGTLTRARWDAKIASVTQQLEKATVVLGDLGALLRPGEGQPQPLAPGTRHSVSEKDTKYAVKATRNSE